MKNTEVAFKWIVEILEKHKVQFRISGGLAARAYGSERPLADIDIDIPDDKFQDIIEDVRGYIIEGPERFIDENWDIYLMTLNFEGQEIDICSATAKIRNHATGEWEVDTVNLSKFDLMEIYGLNVPVIPKKDLIDYKKKLGREVDIEDVVFLEGN
jgi:hypothetical protein